MTYTRLSRRIRPYLSTSRQGKFTATIPILESIIQASLDKGISLFSHSLIKALNVHAIAGLHSTAGEYRSTEVVVGNFSPVDAALVPSEMDDLALAIQRNWLAAETVNLGAFTLWVINHIHPFVNGNGRTARALCYHVICVKAGHLLRPSDLAGTA